MNVPQQPITVIQWLHVEALVFYHSAVPVQQALMATAPLVQVISLLWRFRLNLN